MLTDVSKRSSLFYFSGEEPRDHDAKLVLTHFLCVSHFRKTVSVAYFYIKESELVDKLTLANESNFFRCSFGLLCYIGRGRTVEVKIWATVWSLPHRMIFLCCTIPSPTGRVSVTAWIRTWSPLHLTRWETADAFQNKSLQRVCVQRLPAHLMYLFIVCATTK